MPRFDIPKQIFAEKSALEKRLGLRVKLAAAPMPLLMRVVARRYRWPTAGNSPLLRKEI
jgi:hypothetical protein